MQRIEICTLEEYLEAEPDRVNEQELAVGGLYTVMFRFRENVFASIRYTARLEDLTADEKQSHRISLMTLDSDLRPLNHTISSSISDGLMEFRKGGGYHLSISGGHRLNNLVLSRGFCQGYSDPMEELLQSTYESVSVPVR